MYSSPHGSGHGFPVLDLSIQASSSRTKGIAEVLTGCYPAFIFGGRKGKSVPVFHFHEVSRKQFEPYLAFLAENGYYTISSEALEHWVHKRIFPGDKAVVLHFDDAWNSLWFEAAPLLKQYNFQASVFVSPTRMPATDAPPRDRIGHTDPRVDRTHPLFCRWSELQSMQADGLIEVQSHGLTHAQVFSHPEIRDWLQPSMLAHPHEIPLVKTHNGYRFLRRQDVGVPLFPTASRFSDFPMWINPAMQESAKEFVHKNGGSAFFTKPDWRQLIMADVSHIPGRWETSDEQEKAILNELTESKAQLECRLKHKVSQICFPWMLAGNLAEKLAAKAGYSVAFAEQKRGKRTVCYNARPFRLQRLKHRYIFSLPGKGRKYPFNTVPNADAGLDTGLIPLEDAP